MLQTEKTSTFQKIIEVIEQLSLEDREILVDIIQNRLKQERREQLFQEVTEAERDYVQGNVRSGSVSELLKELQ